MKHILYLSCFLVLSQLAIGQGTQTPSNCNGSDFLKAKLQKDADRLTQRRTYHSNDNYKDSIVLKQSLRSLYMKALLAVNNLTTSSSRDTVIDTLKIHTNLSPELNFISVSATPSLSWMQNLKNSILPTLNPTVDKYHLQIWSYYQSTFDDKVVFKADSNYNLLPLTKTFSLIPGVNSSVIESGYDDVRNITDSINPNYTELTYSYGWGTCANGCDFRQFWTFRVYTDCAVDYMGTKGDNIKNIFAGLKSSTSDYLSMNAYPNPVKDVLFLDLSHQNYENMQLSIQNVFGQEVYKITDLKTTNALDLKSLEAGVYCLKIIDGVQQQVIKIIKE